MTMPMTAEENKYFETGGESELPEVVETPTETVEKPAETKAEPEPRTVREEAYRREQDQRRKAEKEARELREQIAYLKGRQEQPQEKPKPVEIPDFNQDPATHLKVKVEQVDKVLSDLAKSAEDQRKLSEQDQRKVQFRNDYARQAAEFAKSTPDFGPAYNHALEQKRGELEDAGMTGDRLEQTLEQWEEYIAAVAMESGRNPGEAIYKIAQRAGFKKAEAKEAPRNDKGQFVSGEDKLKTIADGQEKGAGLGAITGSGVSAEPSLQALLSMPRRESAKIVTDEAKWRKLMGAEDE